MAISTQKNNLGATASKATNGKIDNTPNEQTFPLSKLNFILMGIAGAMIIIGFLLMTGESTTMEHFNADIFDARRIVVGPTIAFLGFIFMAFGIIYRTKKEINE